jgi:hypothetical protein
MQDTGEGRGSDTGSEVVPPPITYTEPIHMETFSTRLVRIQIPTYEIFIEEPYIPVI